MMAQVLFKIFMSLNHLKLSSMAAILSSTLPTLSIPKPLRFLHPFSVGDWPANMMEEETPFFFTEIERKLRFKP